MQTQTQTSTKNIFGSGEWWRADGEFKMLHAINPLRLRALEEICGGMAGKHLADIGCGGGIFSEAAAKTGARVTAVDTNENAIAAACEHAQTSGLDIDYRTGASADLANEGERYEIAACFEVLEHADSPPDIVADISAMLKPGGWAAFSTINRTWLASFLMIDIMEKTLNAIPRGAHNAEQFITPRELAGYCADAGLTVRAIKGLRYSFFGKHFYLDESRFPINYFLFARREN